MGQGEGKLPIELEDFPGMEGPKEISKFEMPYISCVLITFLVNLAGCFH